MRGRASPDLTEAIDDDGIDCLAMRPSGNSLERVTRGSHLQAIDCGEPDVIVAVDGDGVDRPQSSKNGAETPAFEAGNATIRRSPDAAVRGRDDGLYIRGREP